MTTTSDDETTFGGFGKTFWEVAVLGAGFTLFAGTAFFFSAGE